MPQPSSLEKILEWEEKIRQQKLSGLTIQSWCRQHHVTPCSFHYWKKRLTVSPLTPSSFNELKSQGKSGVIIECNGICLHAEKDLSLKESVLFSENRMYLKSYFGS